MNVEKDFGYIDWCVAEKWGGAEKDPGWIDDRSI